MAFPLNIRSWFKSRSTPFKTFLISALALCVISFLFVQRRTLDVSPFSLADLLQNNEDGALKDSTTPSCPEWPLIDDVVVIFKTGATESERVPAHVNTDLVCLHHLVLGSDAEDEIDGMPFEDILKNITDEIKASEQDFSFYRSLHGMLEDGQSVAEALTDSSDLLKEDTPAWKLDKWKFEPLLHAAVDRYPSSKWYVFMEADTYVLWPVMLDLLSRYDHTERRYIGAQNIIGDMEFAHGGSGYVLSHAAAHAASAYLRSEPGIALELIQKTCCGDMAMGDILRAVNTGLTSTWPTIQGETPDSQDYTARHWCAPVATFHHMSPTNVAEMWDFEQSRAPGVRKPTMHKDIFAHFVQPYLQSRLEDWDNLSSHEQSLAAFIDPAHESFEACQALCESDDACLQFSWRVGECHTSNVLRLGGASSIGSIISGFLLNRVANFTEALGNCDEPRWPG